MIKDSFSYTKILTWCLLGVLLLVGTLGISIVMAQDHTGAMTSCPLMNGLDTMCPMGAMEHLQQWRNLFTATTTDTTLLGMIMLLVFVGLGAMWLKKAQLLYEHAIHTTLHELQKPELRLGNHLILAFSHGILNPKIF